MIQNQSKPFFYHKVAVLIGMATLLLGAIPAISQDMTPGFAMLNSGRFLEAKDFFNTILQESPENKTALICYGRATGLSGNVEESQQIFHKLLINEPSSEEVKLNLAESFLWAGNGQKAAEVYTEILEVNETSFVALMGYANSMSMLKNYQPALEYINKALEKDPSNEQAKVSRKYIRLGLADELASQHGHYRKALELVDQNLEDNPQDQNSWMLKATIFLLSERFEEASEIYSSKITSETDKYTGWSVAEHLLKKEDKALSIAREGLAFAEKAGNPDSVLKMKRHYVTALLWNKKLKEAREYTEQLSEEYPENPSLLETRAQVFIYLSDYERGLEQYALFLETDSASFSGNLGSADAFHALGMDNTAYKMAFQTLKYYPGQKDVVNFINKLNAIHAPGVATTLEVSRTSDKSTRIKKEMTAHAGIAPLTMIRLGYNQEVFANTFGDEIKMMTLAVGADQRFGKRIKASADVFHSTSMSQETPLSFINYKTSLNIRVSRSQLLIVGNEKEQQNFTRDLLAQNISMQHFLAKNSMYWKIQKVGWYTEVYHSRLSDGNSRNLLFTSVYKNLTDEPVLKTGINYSAMGFKNTRPTEYFSPLSFHSLEWFAGFNINQSKTFPFTIMADAAVGYQVSEGNQIVAWRGKIQIEREIKRFEVEVYAMHNSLSAVTSNGFSFSKAGVTLRYKLTKKPLFHKKYSKN